LLSKIAILTIILPLLTSCGVKAFRFPNTTDHFKSDLAKADPDFKLGWDHGCETGASSGSNQFYKIFYKSNKQDGWKMASSPTYKNAWNYGYWYCMREEYVDQNVTMWGSIFGGVR
jgi:hypothetical protein